MILVQGSFYIHGQSSPKQGSNFTIIVLSWATLPNPRTIFTKSGGADIAFANSFVTLKVSSAHISVMPIPVNKDEQTVYRLVTTEWRCVVFPTPTFHVCRYEWKKKACNFSSNCSSAICMMTDRSWENNALRRAVESFRAVGQRIFKLALLNPLFPRQAFYGFISVTPGMHKLLGSFVNKISWLPMFGTVEVISSLVLPHVSAAVSTSMPRKITWNTNFPYALLHWKGLSYCRLTHSVGIFWMLWATNFIAFASRTLS